MKDPADYLPANQKPVIFLDYDGTLTPIVNNPREAYLSTSMRDVVSRVAADLPVAIVSGRERKNVQQLVGLEQVYYAGSHGYDISGPDNIRLELSEAQALVPELKACHQQLQDTITGFTGAELELKHYSIAVHYRNLNPAWVDALQAQVNAVLQHFPYLRLKGGKKVFEVQPALDWDKGRAMLWLMDHIGDTSPPSYPIFIGDDLTDETAFEKMPQPGLGILVGPVEWQTAAQYYLPDVREVEAFLMAVHTFYLT